MDFEIGRPADGYFTKRTAEAWLRGVLDQARRGKLPGLLRTRVKFAEAWLTSGCFPSSTTATASRRQWVTAALSLGRSVAEFGEM